MGRDKVDDWEIARGAREIDPEFRVVYMSGNGAENWASKGVPNKHHVVEVFRAYQLFTAVSQLLNSGTPMTYGKRRAKSQP